MEGQLFDAARNGDVGALAALLDKHPEKLHVRTKPHEQSLLHLAAFGEHFASVDLLLRRGLDVNARDDELKGDLSENSGVVEPGGTSAGVLHLMTKRNSVAAVKWPARPRHGSERSLEPLGCRGDGPAPRCCARSRRDRAPARRSRRRPTIRDSKHDGDAVGWADYFRQPEIVQILEAHASNT